MVIYNVTLKVELNAEQDWVKWMHEIHMPDVYNTGLFLSTHLYKLLEQDESDGVTYVAKYHCNSLVEYNKYINEFALEMRERGMKAFGGKFVAFRTVMEKSNP